MIKPFPQPGKKKSRQVVEAFVAGAPGYAEGAAFFGVVGLEREFRGFQTRKTAVDWFYGDNAFFDRARGRYFRFARNALQVHELGRPDHGRRRALGIEPAPWRKGGSHIVVVEQSEHFMSLTGQHPMWVGRVVAELRRHTDREIRIRRWSRSKGEAAAGLAHDLVGAWALVTWASAAANEALISGVPVFVGGKMCAAAPMSSGDLARIEAPDYPDGREDWAAWLAGMQWTLEELRDGAAWRALSGGR